MAGRTKREPVEYAAYLRLDRLLDAQDPVSWRSDTPAHDEHLFIVIHQVYELWFKEILHDLRSAIEILSRPYVEESAMATVVGRIERIVEIFKILVDQVRVLETMAPLDFLEFRGMLAPASGFQSAQFREIENRLGLPREQRVKLNASAYETGLTPAQRERVLAAEAETSLFDALDRWLARTPFLEAHGFDFAERYLAAADRLYEQDAAMIRDNERLTEDEKVPELRKVDAMRANLRHLRDEATYQTLLDDGSRRLSFKATWASLVISLYRDYPIFHLPYRLLTLAMDLDELLTTWRYRHALMALRMIGTKVGTGGTGGYDYLRTTVEKHRVFQDFFQLATFLIPRSERPELPASLARRMDFAREPG